MTVFHGHKHVIPGDHAFADISSRLIHLYASHEDAKLGDISKAVAHIVASVGPRFVMERAMWMRSIHWQLYVDSNKSMYNFDANVGVDVRGKKTILSNFNSIDSTTGVKIMVAYDNDSRGFHVSLC